jgi:hypothetical protein
MGLKPCGAHSTIPFGEKPEERVSGDFRVGGEFQDRWRVAEFFGERGDGAQNLLFVVAAASSRVFSTGHDGTFEAWLTIL